MASAATIDPVVDALVRTAYERGYEDAPDALLRATLEVLGCADNEDRAFSVAFHAIFSRYDELREALDGRL